MLPDFPFADDHPNAEAHRWVSRSLTEVMAALEADAYPRDFGPLLTRADVLPPAFRVAQTPRVAAGNGARRARGEANLR